MTKKKPKIELDEKEVTPWLVNRCLKVLDNDLKLYRACIRDLKRGKLPAKFIDKSHPDYEYYYGRREKEALFEYACNELIVTLESKETIFPDLNFLFYYNFLPIQEYWKVNQRYRNRVTKARKLLEEVKKLRSKNREAILAKSKQCQITVKANLQS